MQPGRQLRESKGNPDDEWTWGNDTPVWMKPRRTVYFIYRQALGGGLEYLNDKRGRLRTWKSQETVKEALAKLLKKATHDQMSAYVSLSSTSHVH